MKACTKIAKIKEWHLWILLHYSMWSSDVLAGANFFIPLRSSTVIDVAVWVLLCISNQNIFLLGRSLRLLMPYFSIVVCWDTMLKISCRFVNIPPFCFAVFFCSYSWLSCLFFLLYCFVLKEDTLTVELILVTY